MSLDLLLRHWGSVEADFQRYYRIQSPLLLSWRKFLALFAGLPPEGAFGRSTHEERMLESMSASERMDYYRKKHGNNITAKDLEKMANS